MKTKQFLIATTALFFMTAAANARHPIERVVPIFTTEELDAVACRDRSGLRRADPGRLPLVAPAVGIASGESETRVRDR